MGTYIRNFIYNAQIKKRLAKLEIQYELLCKYWRGGTGNREQLRMHLNSRQLNSEEREDIESAIEAILTDRADFELERMKRKKFRQEGKL